MNGISIRALGKVEQWVLEHLQGNLADTFGREVEVGEALEVPDYAYDRQRRQYCSTVILALLGSVQSREDEALLAVVDLDLYVPQLNFVFGEADPSGKRAIISLFRLRQEYYGLPGDAALLARRAAKEAVHELGHVYDLGHCPDARCVMYFSNSLRDTDLKGAAFCVACDKKMRALGLLRERGI